MKYTVSVDAERVEVEILERAGHTYVVRDGVEVAVELCSVRDGAYTLFLGQRSLPVVASGANDDLALVIGAETWHCSVQDQREALGEAVRGTQGGRKGGVVRAVMPGIVREVLVEPGREVHCGVPLVVLEAMKMQNEVRSDADGTVTHVHVVAGTAVAKGDKLVTIA